MQILHLFRRINLCQSVSVLFLMIIVSSGLINAVPAPQLDEDIVQAACNTRSPAFRPLILVVKKALGTSVPLAERYFRKELNRDYNHAMESIHTLKTRYRVIQSIPKDPGTHTPEKVLAAMNETNTLETLYKHVHTLHFALADCKSEAYALNITCELPMFVTFLRNTEWVQRELMRLFFVFKTSTPKVPEWKRIELAQTENAHVTRTWVTIHDYLLVLEYTDDVARHLLKKYCNKTME